LGKLNLSEGPVDGLFGKIECPKKRDTVPEGGKSFGIGTAKKGRKQRTRVKSGLQGSGLKRRGKGMREW